MRRRVLLLALSGLGGMLVMIGPSWLGALLLFFIVLKSPRSDWLVLGVATILALVWGWRAQQERLNPPLPVGPVRVMPGDWTLTGNLLSYTGRASNGVPTGGQATATDAQIAQLERLDAPIIITWQGEVEPVSGATNQYEFDYRSYRWFTAQQAYSAPRQPLKMKVDRVQGIVESLIRIRTHFQQSLDRLPKTVSRYAKGLLLGQTDRDFDTVRDQLVKLGIIHLFSVSGLHLFVLFAALYALTDRLRIPKETADWALLVTLPALLVLIPSGAGIVRAVLFRMLVILNDRLNWHYTRLDLLSGALLINLFVQPFVLHTFGGQMSYLMTAVIVTAPPLSRFKLALRLWLVGIPVIIAQTFRVQLLAVVFNWLLVPIFELLILPLLAVVVIFPRTPLTPGLEMLLLTGEKGLAWLATLPGELVFGALSVPVALAGVIVAAAVGAGRHPVWLVLWLATAWTITAYQPKWRVTIFDVGQGDAILVEAPFRQGTVLIDTGGLGFGERRNPPAKRVILNYLAARGISALDALVLTHADADHVGDADIITQGLRVRQLVVTRSALPAKMIQEARAGQVDKTTLVAAGDKLRAGAIQLQVVAPNGQGDPTNKNEDSIVLYGTIDKKRWLFTGDADQQVETEQLMPQHLQVDFLKAGHHGSRTSSAPAFIDAIQPSAAFISTGRNNRYGHPHQETVETFAAARVPLYNTADSGMLWVEDGRVHQFLNEESK